MKYSILFHAAGQDIETSESVRVDASDETTYRRIAVAAAAAIRAHGLFPDSVLSYSLDLPNLWTNGFFGRICLYADDAPIDGWDGRVLAFREDGLQYTY